MLSLYRLFMPRRLEEKLDHLIQELQNMTPALQQLKDQISQNNEVAQSAVTLIHGLADKVLAAKDDPAAIAELVAELKTQASSLSAAVVENTPAADAQPANPPPAAPAATSPADDPPTNPGTQT